MGHSDEWTFADYFKYEKEIYRAIISAAVLCRNTSTTPCLWADRICSG